MYPYFLEIGAASSKNTYIFMALTIYNIAKLSFRNHHLVLVPTEFSWVLIHVIILPSAVIVCLKMYFGYFIMMASCDSSSVL